MERTHPGLVFGGIALRDCLHGSGVRVCQATEMPAHHHFQVSDGLPLEPVAVPAVVQQEFRYGAQQIPLPGRERRGGRQALNIRQ